MPKVKNKLLYYAHRKYGKDIIVNPFDDPVDMSELPFPYEKTDSGKTHSKG